MASIIRELFRRRNLIRELVIKDLKMRYARPGLGLFWAFLSPLFMIGIFYLVFAIILQIKIKEAPFILYLMSAVFPWRLFQDSLMCSATSLVDNKNLIRESNFPHYFIPLSIVLANGINFLPSLGILIATSLLILKGLPLLFMLLPAILGIHLIATLGLSLIVSILYVRWRDTKYILEAVLQILFYLTPAVYSFYLVKDSFSASWFKIYINNPFVGILNLYRLVILKGFYSMIKEDLGLLSLVVTPAIFTVGALLLGIYIYERNKNSINDYLSY